MDIFDHMRRMEEEMDAVFIHFEKAFFPKKTLLENYPEKTTPEKTQHIQRKQSFEKQYTPVLETETQVIVTLPTEPVQHLKLSVQNDVLTIRAQTKQEQRKEEKTYSTYAFALQQRQQHIRLPAPVDASKAHATYQDGMLRIELPKTRLQEESYD